MCRYGTALGSLLLLLPVLLLHVAYGHVRLTFPPARYPALDFLDSARTPPPCGVPKPAIDKGIRTSIASGSTFNITWFTAFPHHGGYRIEVLNDKEEPITVLTSTDAQFVSENDTTQDSQTVTLPEDLECSNCAIRLLRQATEWGADYQLFSCADVNIVKTPGPDTCLGHGMRKNGTCECDRLYSGLACQNADECWADHDCGVNGKCQEVSSSEYPQRRCYCKSGFYGEGCLKRSDARVKASEFDESLYQLREVGEDKNRIYWRIVDDEIEVVLKFPGQSWVALGWKPQTQDKTCASIGQYSPAEVTGTPEPAAEPGAGGATAEPEPTAEGSPHPEPGAEPEPSAGTNATSSDLPSLPQRPIVTVPVGVGNVTEIACTGPNEAFSTCPEFNRLCEASCEWTTNPDTVPGCPRACGAPRCVCNEGFVRATNANDSCVPFNDCALPSGSGASANVSTAFPSSGNGSVCAGNSTWAECGIACEPTCENMHDTAPCPAVCEAPACTCADTYVRHNGQCIYWGDCPEMAELSSGTPSPSVELETAPFTVNNTAFTSNVPLNVEIPIVSTPIPAGGQNLSCGLNETINECGTICEPDCDTIFTRKQCEICGTPSCSCIQGYARFEGQCVYWGDCPLDVSGLETAPTSTGSPSDSPLNIVPITQPTVKAVSSLPTTSEARTTGGGQPTSAGRTNSSAAFSSKTATRPATLPSINAPPQIVKSAETEATDATGAPTAPTAPGAPVAGHSEVVGDVCYGDWRWPAGCRDCDYRVSWNYLDDTDEIEFSIETRAPTNWWTGIGFSSTGTMTQADMIIVKSQNGALSLHDMYSEGYTVPRDDADQNVYTPTVIGTHVNGVLRAQFTRKRDTGDTVSDHRFTDATCYKFLFPVSGGRLDENGQISKHITTPVVSEKKVCVRSCVKPQTTKASSTCQREYKHPTGCEGTSCDYIAKWEYSPSRKDIRFEISAREIGRWTGIGFSRDGGMTNSDIYTGWFYEGKAYVTDRFAYGRQLPAVDPSGRQDIYETGGRVEDDIQTIWFRRKIVPEDTLTDFPLDKCYYFLFPVGGGRVLARKAADFQDALTPIGYHDLYQPRVSREKICICDGNGKSIAAEEEALNTTVRHRRQADPFSAPVDPQVGLPPKASGNGTAEAEPSAEPSLNGTSSLEQDVSQEVVEPHEVEPHAEGSANNTTAAHAEPEPGSEPTSSVEPEPEAHDHADHAHSEPEPHPEGHASNETHTEAQPEPETSGEPTSEPHGDHDHDHDHAHAEPEPHPTGEATAEPHPTGEAEPEPHPTGESEPEPHPTGAAEPEPHPTGEAEPEPSGEPAASPKAPAGWSGHPMDCADIVVGTAIGMTTQVRDYYTVSRATPRLDEYYGGKQSITSASGFEEDGVTTIVFRKKLQADDKTDHSIVPGPMTVIWAKGQQYPNYVHNVEPSVFAVGKAGNEQFYENDVLLYHGAKSRGVLTLDFFEGAKAATGDCNGMFAYPTGCTDAACTYIIKWTSDGKTVSFQLDTALPVGHWSGIGFSKDGSMNGVDALVAIVEENGSVQVSDQFAPTYGRPIVDPEQGVFGVAGQYQNGRLMANFSRNLDTNDAANDLSLTECQFFLYPHSGGALEGGSVAVRKHTSTPTTSTKKICLKSCSSTTKDVSSVTIPTKKPNSNEPDVLLANTGFSTKQEVPRYSLVFRITNLEWNEKLANVDGMEFKQLASPVKQAIDQVLADKWPGMEVSRVVKFTAGSVLAHVEVVARDESQEPTPAELVGQVENRASAGRIGTFEIEPTTIRAARLNKVSEDRHPSPEEIRNWIIIGVAGLLVLIAILFAVCMILRTRKTKSKDFKSNSRYVPFSPYSYMFNQGYPGTYPGGYQYPPGPMTDKAKGFDNQAYQTAGQHSRQFSQATTATNNGGKGSPGSSEASPDGASPPAGVGETTYQEWYQKVASNPASQQHQEIGDRPPPPKQSPSSSQGGRGAYGGPYVSYPNDPMNYYTLNGQHRIGGGGGGGGYPVGRGAMPPPGYYRPY